MAVLLMMSAKFFFSTTIDEWKTLINEDTVLITEQNAQTLNSAEIRSLFADSILVENYFENAEVLNLISKAHQYYKFSKIIALSEGDLLRAAKVRKLLKIPGESAEDLIYFRDKDLMKKLAICHGVRVAAHKKVETVTECMSFMRGHGFPIILKPIDGRGSASTYQISDEKALKDAFNQINSFPLLLEQYIKADMYHIDGIVVAGKVKLCSPARYVNNCLDFVHGADLGSYVLMPENPLRKKLIDFATYLLECVFPTPKLSLFHIEVFVDPDGQLTLCEIAARLGGNSINKEVLLAYGVDLKKCYLNLCYSDNNQIDISNTPILCAGRYLIPPQTGRLIKKPTLFSAPFIIESHLNTNASNTYHKMKMSNDELINFLLIANSESEMQAHFNEIKAWRKTELKWESLQ